MTRTLQTMTLKQLEKCASEKDREIQQLKYRLMCRTAELSEIENEINRRPLPAEALQS